MILGEGVREEFRFRDQGDKNDGLKEKDKERRRENCHTISLDSCQKSREKLDLATL